MLSQAAFAWSFIHWSPKEHRLKAQLPLKRKVSSFADHEVKDKMVFALYHICDSVRIKNLKKEDVSCTFNFFFVIDHILRWLYLHAQLYHLYSNQEIF